MVGNGRTLFYGRTLWFETGGHYGSKRADIMVWADSMVRNGRTLRYGRTLWYETGGHYGMVGHNGTNL